jgi:hypothetical protein
VLALAQALIVIRRGPSTAKEIDAVIAETLDAKRELPSAPAAPHGSR